MMMYSLPIAFEESSLQSRIVGMGIVVLHWTSTKVRDRRNSLHGKDIQTYDI